MSRKVGYVLMAAVVIVLVAAVVWAQGGGGGMGPGPGGMGRGGGGGMAGGMSAMLDQMGLSAGEKAAVERAAQDKMSANQQLRSELQRLQAVADRAGVTAADAKKAVASYLGVKAQIAKKNAQTDATLMKSLSPVAQAKCLAAGIVDNGLGMRGMMGRRGGGMGAGGYGRRSHGTRGRAAVGD